jgi:hypothetical protein
VRTDVAADEARSPGHEHGAAESSGARSRWDRATIRPDGNVRAPRAHRACPAVMPAASTEQHGESAVIPRDERGGLAQPVDAAPARSP